MKTFLKAIAWVGLGFMVIGTAISLYIWMALTFQTPVVNPGFGPEALWFISVPIAILALIFMFVGGLITRPRYFWLASISIGALSITVSLPPEWNWFIRKIQEQGMYGLLVALINHLVTPGLLSIILGIIILVVDKSKPKKKMGNN